MEEGLDISLIISIGGVIASVASSMAISKTKVARLENAVDALENKHDSLVNTLSDYKANGNVKIAVLEKSQENLEKEMMEIKGDIKTIMTNVADIKEVILKVKKGA